MRMIVLTLRAVIGILSLVMFSIIGMVVLFMPKEECGHSVLEWERKGEISSVEEIYACKFCGREFVCSRRT